MAIHPLWNLKAEVSIYFYDQLSFVEHKAGNYVVLV